MALGLALRDFDRVTRADGGTARAGRGDGLLEGSATGPGVSKVVVPDGSSCDVWGVGVVTLTPGYDGCAGSAGTFG